MAELTDFQLLCRQVRFALDEAVEPEENEGLLADLVARVRSNGLQVTRRTVPELHAVVSAARRALAMSCEPEVYVVNDPASNAFAPVFGDGVRPFVVLNSGLISLLGVSELAFALGHELGHLGMRHGRALASPPRSEFEAIQMRTRQRYAEVSADRVGLLATRSLFTAANVMVKLASGLPTTVLGLDVETFLQQIEHDPLEFSATWELEQSHPSLPQRLWALLRFARSDVYCRLAGLGDQAIPLEAVDDEIALRFAELGDSRLTELESRAYDIALVWAATAVAMEDEYIDPRERQALERLLGVEHADKAVAFAESQGRPAVTAKLADAVARINAAGVVTRQKFLDTVRSLSASLGLTPQLTETWQLLERTLRLKDRRST